VLGGVPLVLLSRDYPMNPPAPAHGGQLHAIAERFNVDPAALLDFSANINPDGPPPSVLHAMRLALDDPSTLFRYPDLEEHQLRHAIADYCTTASENITVANGFVPLLEAALQVSNIRSCLLPVPSFAEYRRTLQNANVQITPHLLHRERAFRYDYSAILEALISNHHDALVIANPQNPCGTLHQKPELLELVRSAAKFGVHVFLDEAFIDYTPTQSLVRHVEELPNLTVFRSVTKFHGIPGLRVAYVAKNRTAAHTLRDRLAPWAITTLASIGVKTALADTDFAYNARQSNHRRRESLREQLSALRIHTCPSSANFLLLRFAATIDTEALWQRLIIEHGIVLRNCSTFEGLPLYHLRCSVRTDSENAKLLAALSLLLKVCSNKPDCGE
jgi:threonine-phosphate decarboxylase